MLQSRPVCFACSDEREHRQSIREKHLDRDVIGEMGRIAGLCSCERMRSLGCRPGSGQILLDVKLEKEVKFPELLASLCTSAHSKSQAQGVVA